MNLNQFYEGIEFENKFYRVEWCNIAKLNPDNKVILFDGCEII